MIYVGEWSENNLQKLVLFFYYVGPGDQTQFSDLVAKHLYPLGHLAATQNLFLETEPLNGLQGHILS